MPDTYTCQRCSWQWQGRPDRRVRAKPAQCPHCKRADWEKKTWKQTHLMGDIPVMIVGRLAYTKLDWERFLDPSWMRNSNGDWEKKKTPVM